MTISNGRKPILQGLKGYAKPGQFLAIMGLSGSGKSTLLDALANNEWYLFKISCLTLLLS